jgi:Bacteriophage Mu Gam like protein
MSTPYEQDLDEFLAEAEAPPDIEARDGPWKIPDDGAANWCLRKLAQAEADLARIQATAAEHERRIATWRDKVAKRPTHDRDRWTALLREYALRRREQTGEKSLSLPNGELRTVHRPAAVEVTANDLLVEWMESEHPELRAAWCKFVIEAQVSRFKEDVVLANGAVCDRCGHHLVAGWTDGLRRERVWRGPWGQKCPRTPDAQAPHRPRTDASGEILEIPVVVWAKDPEVPIPGLGVRPEAMSVVVTPDA